MRFLPIVDRELRVSARRRGTYWLRSFVALVVIVVSTCIFIFNLNDSPRDVAKVLFYTLTAGALLYCLLAGLRSTADCLSEEKREGTFGLLFLTDLKGYDVVVGKMVASSLSGFYGLLAILPVMGIPLLMGGLTGTQMLNVAIVLVNTMFFSMCLGIFASSVSRSGRKSMAFTFFLILLFTAGVPALGAFLSWKFHWRFMEQWLPLSSPVFSYWAGANPPATIWPNAFYWSVGVIHGLAWIFLILACIVAPRSWQDRPAGARRVRIEEQARLISFGDAAQRHAFRTRLLNQNAFYWLAARARLRPIWVWLVLGGVAAIWTWGVAKFRREWLNEFTFIITALFLNSVLKNWVAAEAARQISDDRKMGSLELLLCTPLSVREIMHGQAMALRRQFLGPVIVVLLAELAMLLVGPGEDFGRSSYDTPRICMWLAAMILLVADMVALYWVGMWLGVAARNPKRAFTDTVGRILALPWVAWALFMTFVALFSIRHQFEAGWKAVLGMYFILGVATDIGFGLWARQNMISQFRVVATQRYQSRGSFWKRLFGSGAEHKTE